MIRMTLLAFTSNPKGVEGFNLYGIMVVHYLHSNGIEDWKNGRILVHGMGTGFQGISPNGVAHVYC